jgi:hypothetical protein
MVAHGLAQRQADVLWTVMAMLPSLRNQPSMLRSRCAWAKKALAALRMSLARRNGLTWRSRRSYDRQQIFCGALEGAGQLIRRNRAQVAEQVFRHDGPIGLCGITTDRQQMPAPFDANGFRSFIILIYAWAWRRQEWDGSEFALEPSGSHRLGRFS